jgi:AGZA family xanthine/uracil permease-like MFS transporter
MRHSPNTHCDYRWRAIREKLDSYFEFDELGTNWRTEVFAGVTTFITMAYIVLVNPAILHDPGMPYAAVVCATCISASYGRFAMGIWERYPIGACASLMLRRRYPHF